MKRILNPFPILLASILVFAFATVPESLFSQVTETKEGRAVWVHTDLFDENEEEATQQMNELLDKYADIGINNIFCYNSMMDQHQKGWDLLKILIEEAHTRGIKVHPVFCPGQKVKLEGEIKQHPEWLIRGINGEMYSNLNLAHPGVKKYLVGVISEALKYNIDGIHLDYIRFQINQGFSYDDATCNAFKKVYGFSPLEVPNDCGSMVWCEWIKWNADHVTDLMKQIKKTIDESGKNIVLGADVFPNPESAKVLVGQDWALWINEGLVDIICPMLYTSNLEIFRRYVNENVKIADGKCSVYPGIACLSSDIMNTSEGVVLEVQISRESGADGVVFFSGFSLTDEFIDKLKSTVFR